MFSRFLYALAALFFTEIRDAAREVLEMLLAHRLDLALVP